MTPPATIAALPGITRRSTLASEPETADTPMNRQPGANQPNRGQFSPGQFSPDQSDNDILDSHGDEPLGRRVRRMFSEQGWGDRRRHPGGPWQRVPMMRQALLVLHAAYCLARIGGKVRTGSGRGYIDQAIDLLHFSRQGFDAQNYYMLELYQPDGAMRAEHSLTRYETKNGFFTALKQLQPALPGARSQLGNKEAFHRHCRAHGVPAIPVLGLIEHGCFHPATNLATDAGGEVTEATRRAALLAGDLFIKPRHGKGARDTHLLRGDDGIPLADFAARISEASLVQPRLVNHPAIADLAQDSLIVIRVITCHDTGFKPVVTHGMLRVLGKLEPHWQDATEYGAPIDLASGRLGAFTGDKVRRVLDRHTHHPHTGVPVAGRILAQWPEIAALALRAHAAFTDRMLLGWDIALTPEGPVVVEGNAFPDIAFLQRVHRVPVGRSPLGPLLQRHLDSLNRPRGAA